MRWRIQPRQGIALEAIPDGAERVQILTENFHAPKSRRLVPLVF